MDCPICSKVMSYSKHFNVWVCSCGFEYDKQEYYEDLAGSEGWKDW